MLTDTAIRTRVTPDVQSAPSSPPTNPAKTLVDGATSTTTGAIDTASLARDVVGAAQTNVATADQAYRAISAELSQRSPVAAGAFERQVVEATRDQSNAVPGPSITGAAHGAATSGTRTLVNNPILSVQWEGTRSAWTGKVGFTPGLTELLERNNLTINPQNSVPPAGSVGKGSGHSVGQANNINGTAAETSIANRLRAQGYDVETQVTVQDGQRRLDVVGTRAGADPRFNERVEVESKVGRTGPNPRATSEANLDGIRLSENQTLRGGARVLDAVGRVARPIGMAMDVVEIGSAFRADGNQIGENTGRAVSGLAGGAAGGYGGALAGAAIGTMIFPGVGTVVGGVVGGAIGAIAGDGLGKAMFDGIKSLF